MISIAVFAILAAGVSSTTIMTSRIAHANIYENTAYMVAQSYAEQIKSIRYGEIRAALDNPAENAIPTKSLSIGMGGGSGTSELNDPLTFGVPLQKNIVIDVEEKDGIDVERIMRMWVSVSGQNLTAGVDSREAIEIALNFEWEVATQSGLTRKEGVVRLVKTSVSE